MKNPLAPFWTSLLIGAVLTGGCAQKAETPAQAIETSKTYKINSEQTDYLNNQANNFLKSKEYNDAVELTQYVLTTLDKNSAQAKAILKKAQAELQKAADQVVQETKETVRSLGNQLNSIKPDIQSE